MDKDRAREPSRRGWLCVVRPDAAGSGAGATSPSSQLPHYIPRPPSGSASSSRQHHPNQPEVAPGVALASISGHNLQLWAHASVAYAEFAAPSQTIAAGSGVGSGSGAGVGAGSGVERAVLAVARQVLGGLRNMNPDALALAAPPQLVAAKLRDHVDALAADAGRHAYPDSIGPYVCAVLRYDALVLNEAVLAGMQSLASALGALDESRAEALKVELVDAYARAREIENLGPNGSGVTSPVLPPPQQRSPRPSSPTLPGRFSNTIDDKITNYMRTGQKRQLWLPPEFLLDASFQAKFITEILAFHRRYWKQWSPLTDPSLLFHTSLCPGMWHLNPLVFDASAPHFLGRLVTNHALAHHLSCAERGRLLSQWITIADLLHQQGDIVGWVAIATALLQPPVLRLCDSWAHVPPEIRQLASREFSFEVFELERRAAIPMLDKQSFRTSTEDMGQRYSTSACVPYFGDLIVSDANQSVDRVHSELDRVLSAFAGWNAYVEQVNTASPSAQTPVHTDGTPQFQELLHGWLRAAAWSSSSDDRASRMEASLIVQPQYMGGFRAHFYTQVLPLSGEAMLPVLFTEASPSFRLFPRQSLLLARRDVGQPRIRRSNSFPPAASLATGIRELELESRAHFERNASAHVLAQVMRDLLNVGTQTLDSDADLVFKTFPSEDLQQRRRSSVIESLGRQSILMDSRRQSLQSLSQIDPTALLAGSSNVYTRSSRPVVVKAASLVRLVDVLVLGSAEYVPSTALDGATHMQTLLATYRSYCSPSELLAMLLRRAQGAVNAAKSLAVSGPKHIKWDPLPLEEPVAAQHVRMASQIVVNCIETLIEWASTYFFDFSDDLSVLREMEQGITLLLNEAQRIGYGETLRDAAKRLFSVFVKQRYKVADPLAAPRTYPRHASESGLTNLPVVALEPDMGLAVIERFAQELDVVVADAFARISLSNWMKLVEILELQSAQPSGLYSYISSASGGTNHLHNYANIGAADATDWVVVQDVYSWMGGLFDPRTKQSIADTALPPCIRAMFTLHDTLVDYFVYQIVDPALAAFAQDRSDRMAFVLKMLGILRARMRFFDLCPDFRDTSSTGSTPTTAEAATPKSSSRVPAFLESVLIAALLRPESRMFAQSWLRAGATVAQQFAQAPDSLGFGDVARANASWIYIPDIDISLLGNQGMSRPITPDIGWITERIAEIVTCVPNIAKDQPELINFDKSRYVYNFVRNIETEFAVGAGAPNDEEVMKSVTKYSRLLHPLPQSQRRLDKKMLKESMAKETHGLSKSQAKQLRVFSSIVAAEVDRLRQEARFFAHSASHGADGPAGIHLPSSQSSTSIYSKRISRLVPGSLPSSASTFSLSLSAGPSNAPTNSSTSGGGASTSSLSSSAPRDPPPANPPKGRSRLGGLFKAVRPLSVLGGGGGSGGSSGFLGSANNNMPAPRSPTPSPPSKIDPSLLPRPQDLPPFQDASWKMLLDLPLAGAYIELVPAGSEPPSLKVKGRDSAEILLQPPSPGESARWLEALEAAVRSATEASTLVFGVSLAIAARRENALVPRFFEELLASIEDRGLEETGLYRISGSLAAVQALKSQCDRGQHPLKLDKTDVNAIAGCVKMYLRELPESLLTASLFNEFIATAGTPDTPERLSRVVAKLPEANRAVLQRLIFHLTRVVEHEAVNKMGVPNLTIVFSMNFLPPTAMEKMTAMQQVVSAMITNASTVFAS